MPSMTLGMSVEVLWCPLSPSWFIEWAYLITLEPAEVSSGRVLFVPCCLFHVFDHIEIGL